MDTTVSNTNGLISTVRARLVAAWCQLRRRELTAADLQQVSADLARAQELVTVQLNGLRAGERS